MSLHIAILFLFTASAVHAVDCSQAAPKVSANFCKSPDGQDDPDCKDAAEYASTCGSQTPADERTPAGNQTPQEQPSAEKPVGGPDKQTPQEKPQANGGGFVNPFGNTPVVIQGGASAAKDAAQNAQNEEWMEAGGVGHRRPAGEEAIEPTSDLRVQGEKIEPYTENGKLKLRIWADSPERAAELRTKYLAEVKKGNVQTQAGTGVPGSLYVGDSSVTGGSATNNLDIRANSGNAVANSEAKGKDGDAKDEKKLSKKDLIDAAKLAKMMDADPEDGKISNVINNNIALGGGEGSGASAFEYDGEDGPAPRMIQGKPDGQPLRGSNRLQQLRHGKNHMAQSDERGFPWGIIGALTLIGGAALAFKQGWFPLFFWKRKKEEEAEESELKEPSFHNFKKPADGAETQLTKLKGSHPDDATSATKVSPRKV